MSVRQDVKLGSLRQVGGDLIALCLSNSAFQNDSGVALSCSVSGDSRDTVANYAGTGINKVGKHIL